MQKRLGFRKNGSMSIKCVVLVVFVTLDICYCAEEESDSSLLFHLPTPSASRLFAPAHIVTS